MERMISYIYKAVVGIAAMLLLYALIMTVFVRTPAVIDLPSFVIILYSILLLGLLLAFLYGVKRLAKENNKLFFLLLAVMVILPRVIWVLLIDTKPVSDFNLYYEYAANASKGIFDLYDKTCIVFPHRLGFPLILSVFFRIFGNQLIVAKLLNIVFSLATASLLYGIGKEIFNKKVGQIAAILFALFPSQIMYSSVIASEHLFTVFFLLSIFLLIYAHKSTKLPKQILLYALCAGALSVAQLIRPLAVMLIPLFLMCIFYLQLSQMRLFKNIVQSLKVVCLITVFYFIFFGSLCIIIYQLNGINMFQSSSGYNLLVGTNYKYQGVYNNEDAKILKEFNWDFKEVHQQAQKRAIDRIQSSPLNFLRLVEKKYAIIWGDETYGISWSLAELNKENKWSRWINKNKDIPIGISQYYYSILLLLAFIGARFLLKEQNPWSLLLLLVFFIHVGAYLFLEVQSRYHYPAVVLLLILSGFGVQSVIERWSQQVMARRWFQTR